jgi:hypothetical protein
MAWKSGKFSRIVEVLTMRSFPFLTLVSMAWSFAMARSKCLGLEWAGVFLLLCWWSRIFSMFYIETQTIESATKKLIYSRYSRMLILQFGQVASISKHHFLAQDSWNTWKQGRVTVYSFSSMSQRQIVQFSTFFVAWETGRSWNSCWVRALLFTAGIENISCISL